MASKTCFHIFAFKLKILARFQNSFLYSKRVFDTIGLVTRKRIFFIADFHVLGLFMTKKHDLSDGNFSVGHAPLSPLLDKFGSRLQPHPES
jgi:hypothetical protein